MKIKALIRRLAQIEAKYGNVRVLTWSGTCETEPFMWLKSGAGYSLNYKGLEKDEKKVLILKIADEETI